METSAPSTRQRRVRLTINEAQLAPAKRYTHDLSPPMASLRAEFVIQQQSAQSTHQRMADACATDWNAVHRAVGSLADEHSTL